MLRALWVFGAAFMMTQAAAAEIFKCTSKNGLDLYQNFPCQIDSLGNVPSQHVGSKPTPPLKSIQANAANPALQRGSPTAPLSPGSDLQVGMSAAEVRTIWGEPAEIVQDEPRSGRVEIWQYADGRVVQINVKQRVISIQR